MISGLMDDSFSGLEAKIKEKFKLFTGVRPQEEDQKLFDRLVAMCFEEALVFLAENLGEEGMKNLTEEVDRQETEEEKVKKIGEYMGRIENGGIRLGARLETFLDNLLTAAMDNTGGTNG